MMTIQYISLKNINYILYLLILKSFQGTTFDPYKKFRNAHKRSRNVHKTCMDENNKTPQD